jgi:hypothetical protein
MTEIGWRSNKEALRGLVSDEGLRPELRIYHPRPPSVRFGKERRKFPERGVSSQQHLLRPRFVKSPSPPNSGRCDAASSHLGNLLTKHKGRTQATAAAKRTETSRGHFAPQPPPSLRESKRPVKPTCGSRRAVHRQGTDCPAKLRQCLEPVKPFPAPADVWTRVDCVGEKEGAGLTRLRLSPASWSIRGSPQSGANAVRYVR